MRTLSCAEHYRAMAFAQLNYRESLHDIETCLSVQASKLYSMGFRDPVRRSTLADASAGKHCSSRARGDKNSKQARSSHLLRPGRACGPALPTQIS